MDQDKRLSQLEEIIAELNEQMFLCRHDLEKFRVEHVAMRQFIQNLYESCEHLNDPDLTLEQVLENLKENIRTFARDHNIRL